MNFKFLNWQLLAILFVVSSVFVACDDDDDTPPETGLDIVETAQDNAQFSILVDALIKADLVSTLQGDGPFTVFAPTNDAFAQLLEDLNVESLDDLTAEQLTPILLYHVVGGEVASTDLMNGYVATSSAGPENTNVDVLINIDNGVVLNGNTMVDAADIGATNGIIHQIDRVLLPPTVVDVAINNSDFSNLVSAVLHAGLAETLSGNGPFTVFAPTNDAFADFLMDAGVSSIDELSPEAVEAVLLNHVVSGNVRSTSLSNGSVPTLGENDFEVDLTNTPIINGDIDIVATDVQGTNGVVHVINKVITYTEPAPQTIVDVASSIDDFSILVEAVVKADLVGVLSGEGPFTVFAPTNDAFVQLLEDLGVASLDDLTGDDLRPILLYHVLGGNVMSGDLANGYVPTSSTGPNDTFIDLLVNIDDGVVLNGNTNVDTPDVGASNGTIHIIDRVLLPPTVVDIAIQNGGFTNLVDAVIHAGLAETLSGDGPFTVFAPTDMAFDELLSALMVGSIEDVDATAVGDILLNHVVDGNVLSTGLSNGNVPTLGANPVAINVDTVPPTINGDIDIVVTDIQGSNGVVHVISAVIQ